jgi:hypothetical protein
LTRLKNAFASADPRQKLIVEELIASVRARDFGGALEGFGRFSSNVQLTPEQNQAVDDVITRLRGMTSRR